MTSEAPELAAVGAYMRASVAARLLGVCARTVTRDVMRGHLPGLRRCARGGPSCPGCRACRYLVSRPAVRAMVSRARDQRSAPSIAHAASTDVPADS